MSDRPSEPDDDFDEPIVAEDDSLVLALDGYEGPIDLLLSLARRQKVDLTKISILALADQYLDYLARARRLKIEVAADYLVMAAWLAYLKSRLLLPDEPDEDEPSGEELAEALAFQLARLEAMREASEKLLRRPQLGRDIFARGAPEELPVDETPIYRVGLYDLLKAYATQRRRQEPHRLEVMPTQFHSMEIALKRLTALLSDARDWRTLASFLPPEITEGPLWRSAVAATFSASLELVREGRLQLRQDSLFSPIYMRAVAARSVESQ
ncbi:MAG: segregation/condensation protein A [Rhodospirillaceae bacterium]|nr:segregation/condensation protein A [Rhodospirillaceae bacterium]